MGNIFFRPKLSRKNIQTYGLISPFLSLLLLLITLTLISCVGTVNQVPSPQSSSSSSNDNYPFEASPSSYSFGSVVIDSKEGGTLTISFNNMGDQTFTECSEPKISEKGEDPSISNFEITTHNCSQKGLSPRGRCSVSISASPQMEGLLEADLTLECKEGSASSHLSIIGVAPSLVLLGPSADFVASTTSSVYYTISYSGSEEIRFSAEDVDLSKNGSVNVDSIAVSKMGNLYKILLSGFSGEGTVSLYIRFGPWIIESSLTQLLTVDNTPPESPVGWGLSGPTVGETSKDSTPIVNGQFTTDMAGHRVYLFDGSSCSKQLAMSTVGENGYFELEANYRINGYDDGLKEFYGKVVDRAGNSSACTPLNLSYTLDTKAPTLNKVITDSWSFTNITTVGMTSSVLAPQIVGSLDSSAEENDSVYIYRSSQCSSIPIGAGSIDANGDFSITVDPFSNIGIDDGFIQLYAEIEDQLENRSQCALLHNLYYTLDTIDPSSLGLGSVTLNPTSGSTSSNYMPTIVGTGGNEELGTIEIFTTSNCTGGSVGTGTINNGTYYVNDIVFSSSGSDNGSISFYMLIRDSALNVSSCLSTGLSYTLNISAPSVTIDEPIASDFITLSNQNSFAISGTCSEDGQAVSVSIDAGGASSSSSDQCSAGIWSISGVDLSGVADSATVIITANHSRSDATPASPAVVSISKDITNPNDNILSGTVMLSSPSGGTTSNDSTPHFDYNGGGIFDEDGSTVKIYSATGCSSINLVGTGTISANDFTVNSASGVLTTDGNRSFWGQVTDLAGNSSNCVDLGLSYQLDTTSPSHPTGWSMTNPGSGMTSNDSSPEISGNGINGEDGSTAYIYDDASCANSIGSDVISSGSFSVNITSYAIDGSDDGYKYFYGKIVDSAENSSSCVSLGLNYLYDHTVPADPSGWVLSSPNSGVTSSDTTPQLDGYQLSSENGGLVSIYEAFPCVSTIGTATINNGSFTVSNITYLSNASQDGTKTFFGKITDVAGNESSCVDLNLGYLLDTADPADPFGWTLDSPANGVTSSITTPEISKNGIVQEDGSVVEIYEIAGCGGPLVGSATIVGGSFTVANINYLNDGTDDGNKIFYGKIVDKGNNESPCVFLNLGYKLDTTRPIDPSGWTMVSPNTATTSNIITPQISGNGIANEDGATITIYDDSSCSASVGSEVVAGGSFTESNISYSNDGSDDGIINFYGKLTDVGGNSSNCVNLNLGYKLDTLSPANPTGWTFTNVIDGDTSGNFTPQISGSGLDAENRSEVNIYLSNACNPSIGSAVINSGVFTVTNIAFADNGSADGIKNFYGIITDAGGNSSACTNLSLSYELDTNMKSVSISVPTSFDYINYTNRSNFTISGECSENSQSVDINAGGMTVSTSCIALTWSVSLDLTSINDGPVLITADHLTAPQASLTLTKDTIFPANPTGWTLSSPNSGSISSDYTPRIDGGGVANENGATVDIYSSGGCAGSIVGTAEVSSNAFIVSNITFASDGSADGLKAFYGKITDRAGNSSTCVDLGLSYHLDTVNPSNPSAWTMSSPSTAETSNDITPQITGSGANGDSVLIYDDSSCSQNIGSATVSGGSFTVSNITYLSDGTNDGIKTFYGIVKDSALNSSSCTNLNLGYKLDTVSPSNPSGWTMISPSSGTTSNDSTPRFDGVNIVGEDGSVVKIYTDSGCTNLIGSEVIVNGQFAELDISLATNGEYHFWGKTIDSANNESSCTDLSLSYKFDNLSPANPSGCTMSPGWNLISKDYTPEIICSNLGGEIGGQIKIFKQAGCNTNDQIGSKTISSSSEIVSNIIFASNSTDDGIRNFYAKIIDTAGNESGCTYLGQYTLDTIVGGSFSALTLTVVPSSGLTSNDYTPTLSGQFSGEANGGTVYIYQNDSSCNTAQIGSGSLSAGSFTVNNITFSNSGGDDGTKVFYGKVIDSALNGSSCFNLSLQYLLDTIPPVVTLSSSLFTFIDGIYIAGSQISVKGTCSENNQLVAVGSSPYGVTTNPNCSGNNFQSTMDFSSYSNGQITLTASQFDVALNSPTTIPNLTFTKLTYSQQVKDIDAGNHFTCTLLYDGSIKCLGSNLNGNLGLGHTSNMGDNVNEMGVNLSSILLGGSKKALMMAVGYNHVCVLLDDIASQVKCFGNNSFGQLGLGNTTQLGDNPNEMGDYLATIPSLGSGVGVISLYAGNSRTCALLDNSTVKCWGRNDSGQLGLGTMGNHIGDYSGEIGTSLATINVGNSRKVLTLTMGNEHSCALLDNGQVKCWGRNSSGQLGLGNANDLGGYMTQMGDNLPPVNLGSNRKAVAITSGYNFSCALLDMGDVKCWGENSSGQLGQGHQSNIGMSSIHQMGDNLSPILLSFSSNSRAIAIDAFGDHVCALLDNGRVKCWGHNGGGQLGLGDTNARGDNPDEMGSNLSYVDLGVNRTARAMTTSWGHSCALLDDSTVKCWGINSEGQLGQNGIDNLGDNQDELGNNLSPIKLKESYRSVLALKSGDNYSCALLSDSNIKCWGLGYNGVLGSQSTLNIGDMANEMGDNLSIINLGTNLKVRSFDSGFYHSCALLTNGQMKCWGRNQAGQLGIGSNINRGDLPNTMGDSLPFVNWGSYKPVAVSAGMDFTCTLLDSLEIKCMGNGSYGKLGSGSSVPYGDTSLEYPYAQISVNLGTNIKALSVVTGINHACALLDNGGVKCWGGNVEGELGFGSTTSYRGTSPSQMGDSLSYVLLGTNKKALSLYSKGSHTCAVLDDHTVKCWGKNSSGQLGLGDNSNRGDTIPEMGDFLSYVPLGGTSKVITMGLGYEHGCALLDDSSVKCWGNNSQGQLGQGDMINRGDHPNEMGSNLPSINLGTGGRKTIALSAGYNHSCAILSDSSIKCWGGNSSGQLGKGSLHDLGDSPGEMGDNLSFIRVW